MKTLRLLQNMVYEGIKLQHLNFDNYILSKSEVKRDILFKYWNDKGQDAKPIYHYLGLDKDKDSIEILKYIIEYNGGLQKYHSKIKSLLLTGEPVIIDTGGYTIEYLLTEIKFLDSFEDARINPVGYDIDGLINGDTSSVTLFITGEEYNLGELQTAHNNSHFIGMEEHDVEELMYEIGDVIRLYYDDITEMYGAVNDSADWNIIDGTTFKGKNIPKTKGDF